MTESDIFRVIAPSLSRLDLLIEEKLSVPPALPHIVRPERRGLVVARFALPLDLCKPQNSKRREPAWKSAKHRKAVASAMFLQCRPRSVPLPGRPQVLAIRFSSVEPDRFADWAKVPIDVLQIKTAKCKTGRLGIIVDDSPRHCDVHQWWEPAKPKQGFVYIEVRTG